MTLGMTKYDSCRHIGQALKALLTSMPDAGELLRQFRIHEIQNGWSHSESTPNFRSAAVGLESTRSRQTLHSISWLHFKASRCMLFLWHIFIWSSLSLDRNGCRQCFPQMEHKLPWIWGHISPRGHTPAAANEHIGRSAGLPSGGQGPLSLFNEVSASNFFVHADVQQNVWSGLIDVTSMDVLNFGLYSLVKDTTEGRVAWWESDVTWGWEFAGDGPDVWWWETLTWSYLHRLP